MTPNIYLARVLADERERDFLRQAEIAAAARRSRAPREWPAWVERLRARRASPEPEPEPVVRAPDRFAQQRRPEEPSRHTDAAA
jgi:hypothetical protein